MSDRELNRELTIAGAVLGAIALVYSIGGLPTVVIAAALCDLYIRRIEGRQVQIESINSEDEKDSR